MSLPSRTKPRDKAQPASLNPGGGLSKVLVIFKPIGTSHSQLLAACNAEIALLKALVSSSL
jgi:hypothetical protein